MAKSDFQNLRVYQTDNEQLTSDHKYQGEEHR